jgi:uncharacterized DUF497 family protein
MVTYDEVKRQSNIKNHGFDFLGSEEVFKGFTITREDVRDDYGELRLQTLGLWYTPFAAMQTTLFRSERQKSMKSASTGKTSPTEIFNDPDCPSTSISDWEGAVLKQGGVVVGRARTRGPNRGPE